ncbi:MAG: hypothetical protein QM765_22485 [Myxococcales bacterium]
MSLLLAASTLVTSTLCAGPQFTVVEVKLPNGATGGIVAGLSAGGDVAGNASTGPFLFRKDGTVSTLPPLTGGTSALALTVNSAGQVGGSSDRDGRPEPHAVVWSSAGEAIDISGNSTSTNSYVTAISETGHAAGYMTRSGSGNTHSWEAVFWSSLDVSALERLGVLAGSDPDLAFSEGAALNASDAVVGRAFLTATTGDRAFLWTGGAIQELPLPAGAIHAWARAINDSGVIVGSAAYWESGQVDHAARWASGVATDLGRLPGDREATAFGVNAAGHAVGTSSDGAGGSRAFLWRGAMDDLNALIDSTSGWEVVSAVAINANGQIAGMGRKDGTLRPVRLDPVAGSTDAGLLAGPDAGPAISGLDASTTVLDAASGASTSDAGAALPDATTARPDGGSSAAAGGCSQAPAGAAAWLGLLSVLLAARAVPSRRRPR